MSDWGDTVYLVHYDTSFEPVAGPEDVAELFDDDADMINPQSTQGMRYFFGVQDSASDDHPMQVPLLRVDLDPAIGAGALRWLADGLVGVEDGYEPQTLHVCASSATDLVFVPAVEARVSYRTARTAASRYIATGARPDNVVWAVSGR